MSHKKQSLSTSSVSSSSKWDCHLRKAEDLLISVGKWPINTSRLFGLFPFNFSIPGPPDNFIGLEKSKLFRVDFFSFLRISWTSVGIVSFMYCGIVGYFSFTKYGDYGHNKNKVLNLFSNEGEKFMYTSNGILMVTLSLCTRLLLGWFSDSVLLFWNSLLHLFAAFQRLGYLFSQTRCFKKMHKQIKALTFVCGLVAIFQTLIMISLHSVFQRNRSYDVHSIFSGTLIDFVWFGCVIFVHSNVMVLGLLGFILFVLSACFRAISVELDKIISTVEKKELVEIVENALVEDACSLSFHKHENAFSGDRNGSEDKPTLSNAQSKILTLIELFDEGTETIRHFNRVFAGPIILEVISCISNSIGFVYSFNKLIYEVEADSLENMEEILMRLPSYLLLILRLLILIWICGEVSHEAQVAIKTLQKTPSQVIDSSPALQIKIHMLVTREAANPATISPGNFFPVNKTFFASILSLLGTYYFVLSGFREEGELWNLIRNKTLFNRHHSI